LLFKRYAPFTEFGFGFHGDGRAGPSVSGSARTWSWVNFDFPGDITNANGRSDPTWKVKDPSNQKTAATTCDISGKVCLPTSLKFTAHSYGANPLVPMSPDIDTFVDLEMKSMNGKVFANGAVRGDDFPNAEVFLLGPNAGDVLELFHHATTRNKNTGPLTGLPGAHSGQYLGVFSKPVPF
jgi:hypothetical protein